MSRGFIVLPIIAASFSAGGHQAMAAASLVEALSAAFSPVQVQPAQVQPAAAAATTRKYRYRHRRAAARPAVRTTGRAAVQEASPKIAANELLRRNAATTMGRADDMLEPISIQAVSIPAAKLRAAAQLSWGPPPDIQDNPADLATETSTGASASITPASYTLASANSAMVPTPPSRTPQLMLLLGLSAGGAMAVCGLAHLRNRRQRALVLGVRRQRAARRANASIWPALPSDPPERQRLFPHQAVHPIWLEPGQQAETLERVPRARSSEQIWSRTGSD
jgi:hypothetical protein